VGCLSTIACKEPVDEKSTATNGLADAFQSDSLTIESDDGKFFEFDIYLALDHEQQRRGLMFVRSMPETTGMLFVYDQPAIRSIWMKNTFVPLDLLFADQDGRITTIVHDARPLSLNSRSSTQPVVYVLELNAGTARRLNIGHNSRIIWEQKAARSD
jgi:uncharacterized membrane protein (UPF0127 family)